MVENEKLNLAKELFTTLYQIAKSYASQCRELQLKLDAQALTMKELREENDRLNQKNSNIEALCAAVATEKESRFTKLEAQVNEQQDIIENYQRNIAKDDTRKKILEEQKAQNKLLLEKLEKQEGELGSLAKAVQEYHTAVTAQLWETAKEEAAEDRMPAPETGEDAAQLCLPMENMEEERFSLIEQHTGSEQPQDGEAAGCTNFSENKGNEEYVPPEKSSSVSPGAYTGED